MASIYPGGRPDHYLDREKAGEQLYLCRLDFTELVGGLRLIAPYGVYDEAGEQVAPPGVIAQFGEGKKPVTVIFRIYHLLDWLWYKWPEWGGFKKEIQRWRIEDLQERPPFLPKTPPPAGADLEGIGYLKKVIQVFRRICLKRQELYPKENPPSLTELFLEGPVVVSYRSGPGSLGYSPGYLVSAVGLVPLPQDPKGLLEKWVKEENKGTPGEELGDWWITEIEGETFAPSRITVGGGSALLTSYPWPTLRQAVF
jgi:hypothetical protein